MANDITSNPVIGVILMVAVSVILAIVIAAFVFGMGAELDATQPQEELEGSIVELEGSIKDFRIYNDVEVVIDGEVVLTGDVHIMSTTSNDHMIFVKGE